MSYIVKLYTLRAVLGLNGLLNQALVGVSILHRLRSKSSYITSARS